MNVVMTEYRIVPTIEKQDDYLFEKSIILKNVETLECTNIRTLVCWKIGRYKYWNVGKPVCSKIGFSEQQKVCQYILLNVRTYLKTYVNKNK